MKNKAQIKMMENVGILVVFFILLALAFIFYARITDYTTTMDQDKIYQRRAVSLAQTVSNLPELRCSEENVPISDCFDTLKILSIQEIINNNDRYYFDILSYSKVRIEQIYPTLIDFTIYNNIPLDSQGNPNWDVMTPIQIPISLYSARTDSFGFGILEVGIYER